MSDMSW